MDSEQIRTIAVVGAGLMGAGIAQVFAQAGFHVKMSDINQEIIQRGISSIRSSLKRFEEKGKVRSQEVLGRLTTTVSLIEAVKDADFVVEAVTENMDVKKQIFREADQACHSDVVLATNTSTLSITEIASATTRRRKIAGMHFFYPPQVMRLVELIRGLETSEETISLLRDLVNRLDKTAVLTKDSPGFIANRIFLPMINEAILVLQEGLSTKEDIDTTMKLGFNHPMGPIELADFIGLDTILYAIEAVHRDMNDPKYRPPLLLRQMVSSGYLGRKSGKGFYDYRSSK